MRNKTWLLLKTLLTSTSEVNVLKHSKDKNKLKYAKNNLVGQIVLYVMLALYAALISIGLGNFGMAEQIPALCAGLLFIMPFIFTLIKTNGYLFGFREYDMLMSMPFSVKNIVSAKFLYMYTKSLPMYGVISVAMLIGYAVGGDLTFWKVFAWIILSMLIPVFPMLVASLLGVLVVKIGSHFRYKSIFEAIFIVILILPLMFSRLFIKNTVRNDQIEDIVTTVGSAVDSSSVYIPFAKWFSEAVNEGKILSVLLIVGLVILVYEIEFTIISKFYRQINSKLSSSASHKNYQMTTQKQKNMVQAIAGKEFKRMTGSSVYLFNTGIGEIMVVIIGIALLFIKPDTLIEKMMQGAPVTAEMIFPAIPILLYFFLGMVPTTCCSPSLEGRNYWIIKTLPIDPLDDIKGKILFNLYLSIPFAAFASLAASICFRVSFVDGLSCVAAVISLCVFASVFGLKCGLKHRRLDWENETEVVKQGMAVGMYIIVHMIMCFVLMPLTVIVNQYVKSVAHIMLTITLIIWIFTLFSWKSVKKYSNEL